MSLFNEIKRRKVFQVAAVYAAVAWLLTQVVGTIEEPLGLPDGFFTVVIVLLGIGFPIAILLAWAYNLTPHGIVRDDGAAIPSGHRIEYVFAGILVLALGLFFYDGFLRGEADPYSGLVDLDEPVPGFSDRAAIGVLPALNLSGPELDYLADGLADQIISELRWQNVFPTIGFTTMTQYGDGPRNVPEIAVEVGAGYILDPTFQADGDEFRINVSLQDASGEPLLAQSFTFRREQTLRIQEDIAREIIGRLEPTLIESEINRAERVRPRDMQAFDFVLQAQQYAPALGGNYADRNGEPVTLDGIRHAESLVRQAIELDPESADAFTLLGHLQVSLARELLSQGDADAADSMLRQAYENALTGYNLDQFSATSCSCLTAILGWNAPDDLLDVDRALRNQERAVQLNPSNAFAHSMLAMVYQIVGSHAQGLDQITRAKRLSPRDVNFSHFLSIEALIYLGMGDWDAAENFALDAIDLRDLNYYASVTHILALYARGDVTEAQEAAGELFETEPNFVVEMLWNIPLPGSLKTVAEELDLPASIRFREFVDVVLGELT